MNTWSDPVAAKPQSALAARLRPVALAGNLLYFLFVLHNGLEERFRGTRVEQVAGIGALFLFTLNLVLISRRPAWRFPGRRPSRTHIKNTDAMIRRNFLTHAAAALVITLLCGLIYVTVQQNYRMSANDPQLQQARDMARQLGSGRSLQSLVPSDSVDLRESLGLFRGIYDSGGKPIACNGYLEGKPAPIPAGVFTRAGSQGEDAVTWQPRRGIRMALVVEAARLPGTGFAVAGRSLAEVERRIDNLGWMVFLVWLACLILIGLHGFLTHRRQEDSRPGSPVARPS
ncbi:MAG TPA: hypothetical protein VG870_12605 [Chitinophagaceae bacterium]|nr:hypothetical protein [Chitinophagaceae bacterium]